MEAYNRAPNFKKIQQRYPDAIRVQAKLTNKANPLSREQMLNLCGGGFVLYHHVRADGLQTMIASQMADWSPEIREAFDRMRVTVIYGPQGSGKTTKSVRLINAEGYEADEIKFYLHEHFIKWARPTMEKGIKVIVFDEVAEDYPLHRLWTPYRNIEKDFVPERIIVMIQGKPNNTQVLPGSNLEFINMEAEPLVLGKEKTDRIDIDYNDLPF